MRLEPRVEKLEARLPTGTSRKHVIITAEGHETEALNAYGRENIADDDETMLVVLVAGKRERPKWRN